MAAAAVTHFAMPHLPRRGCASHIAAISPTIRNMKTDNRTGSTSRSSEWSSSFHGSGIVGWAAICRWEPRSRTTTSARIVTRIFVAG